MAKQDAVFTNGRIGNVIYYQWKGIGCVRSAPARVRQTKATRQSAKNFGRAAQFSRHLRACLSPCLPNYKSKEVMHTMNAALLSWLRQEKPEDNISFVGLEFNEKSNLASKLRQQPVVDFGKKGKIVISFPPLKIPQDVPAPSNTKSVRIDIAAVGCMFPELQVTGFASVSIEIPYKGESLPVMKKELEFKGKPGGLNVVAMSLRYTTSKYSEVKEITDQRWMPAAIIGAQMI
jgi:hypothetical protein